MSIGTLVNICAWGLGLGTAFFVLFGLKASKVSSGSGRISLAKERLAGGIIPYVL